MVVAVIASLQGEAVAWAADLYSKHARELADVSLFLEALWLQFEDVAHTHWAEAEVLGLRQQGRPALEYVSLFRRVARKLQSWPERLLVHHFWAGLDGALRRACVVHGVSHRLLEWFWVAVELDIGLQECRGQVESASGSHRPADKGGGTEGPGDDCKSTRTTASACNPAFLV